MARNLPVALTALAFAIGAPVVNVLVSLIWSENTGPFELVRAPVLMRGALVGFAVVMLALILFVRRRGSRLTGFEAVLLWFGTALSFAHTLSCVSYATRILYAPLGIGPHYWGGLVYGLLIAIGAGVSLLIWWQRRRRPWSPPAA